MPLPGEEAQYLMAPVQRPRRSDLLPNTSEYRESAVLLLLTPTENGFNLPLTERFSYKGSHSGQVSFPGGKKDASDPDLEFTALRECHEEIGIHPDTVQILGRLTELYIPVSRFKVTPFVGCLSSSIPFEPNSREVKTILQLGLAELQQGHQIREGNIDLESGLNMNVPYFELEGRKVWGATAMILSEFRTLLNSIV